MTPYLASDDGTPASYLRRHAHATLRAAYALVVAGLLGAVALPAAAGKEGSNVLVLYSNGRLLPANVEGDRGLRAELLRLSVDSPITVFDEFLDVPRFRGLRTRAPSTRTYATSTRRTLRA